MVKAMQVMHQHNVRLQDDAWFLRLRSLVVGWLEAGQCDVTVLALVSIASSHQNTRVLDALERDELQFEFAKPAPQNCCSLLKWLQNLAKKDAWQIPAYSSRARVVVAEQPLFSLTADMFRIRWSLILDPVSSSSRALGHAEGLIHSPRYDQRTHNANEPCVDMCLSKEECEWYLQNSTWEVRLQAEPSFAES